MPRSISSTINYDEAMNTFGNMLTVINVVAEESVIDVVALIS